MQKGDEKKIQQTAKALKELGAISEFKYHKMDAKEVIKQMQSNEKNGLTSD